MRSGPFVCLALLAASCASAAPDRPAADDTAQFERLKSLAGAWTQTGETGAPKGAKVTYRITAGGSTIEQLDFAGTAHEMVTLYTLDHGRLVLTHYCVLGNQPRMELQSVSGNTMVFDLTSLGNGDPSKDMHMHHAEITLVDNAHVKSGWTLWKDGRAGDTHGFALERTSN